MLEAIQKRFTELVALGRTLIQRLPYGDSAAYYVSDQYQAEYQKWISNVVNVIQLAAPKNKAYADETHRIVTHEGFTGGIPVDGVRKLLGVLEAAESDWTSGLLRSIEFVVAAETFDDFLDQAARYHKGNAKLESAVLASAVLEDTTKKICIKNEIDVKGKSLELLIDDLVKADILTGVKAKRVKSAAGVRNHALHAEWDDFDIKDVGGMIETLRELVGDYL